MSKTQEIREQMIGYVSKLINDLQSGYSDSFKQYLKVQSRFRRYSFGNTMLISCQLPQATQVCGFQVWKSLGRSVKKGEKAIYIYAPAFFKKKEKEGEKKVNDDQDYIRYFKAVPVFDISQTEGQDLVNPFITEREDNLQMYSRLKSAVEQRGIVVEEKPLFGGMMGYCANVTNIAIHSGLGPMDKFAVLVHETAHSFLKHGSEENRHLTKGQKECQAEATTYLVMQHFGQETEISKDYLVNWGTNEKVLKENLSAILEVSEEIISILSIDDRADVEESPTNLEQMAA
jgi:antirestriction protein ArdC